MQKIDLKTYEITKVSMHDYEKVEAILFFDEIDEKEYEDERDFLKNLKICIIYQKDYRITTY